MRELLLLFLRLGATAFGGPAAHIAMMEDEVVRRRNWISRTEFLDLLGAVNLIPGPNSTELAIHIGHRRSGWKGLIGAGVCFITPAMLIVLVIAWAYVKFGSLPQLQAVLYAVKPAIIAVVVQALWRMGKTAITSVRAAFLCAACIAGVVLGLHELLVLLLAGAAMVGARGSKLVFATVPLGAGAAGAAVVGAKTFTMANLFLFFLKVGSVLFGSGYVLLAFLRADLVERWHWLSEAQLLDAIAVGQITPGPVFTTATFIGYLLGGTPGALVATLGIFLPAFFFVAVSGPLIPKLRASAVASAFLDGLNLASLALMAVVSFQLGATALVDVFTICIAMLSACLMIRFNLNSAWLVLGAALAGAVKAFL